MTDRDVAIHKVPEPAVVSEMGDFRAMEASFKSTLDSVYEAFRSPWFEVTSYDTGRLVSGVETLYFAVERAVSFQILETKTTSARASANALSELLPYLNITMGPTTIAGPPELEVQTVELSGVVGRPVVKFLPNAHQHSGEHSSPEVGRIELIAKRVTDSIKNLPTDRWRTAVLDALFRGADDPPSPWAEALGPLYSLEAAAARLGWTEKSLVEAVSRRVVLAVTTSEGELLFPVGQFGTDGIVHGVHWVLGQLPEDLVDAYTLAAWMNAKHDDLGGDSIWDALERDREPSAPVVDLVMEFRRAALQ